ncbi:preprotein translocase subunit SecF [Pseudonocardia sediminis]|uniref:Protein-export membrane protein SecF n=1 Tax=Pseudonocardia sediminis TaxID=1397368 RepID=A0A4Q7UYF5_PSEST|nr:protein translocase subunit SecF [Pseudonocardia sediminis]RZT86154.1 preprotein translocase subunit SecF [Pseudonocardia sediminis]
MSTDTTVDASGDRAGQRDSERTSAWTRLTTGTGNIDVVGRKKIWYVMFAVLIVVSILSIAIRGFNLGIDFTGGSQIQLPGTGARGQITEQQVTDIYTSSVGMEPVSVQSVGAGGSSSILIRSESLGPQQLVPLREALFTQLQPLGADGQPNAAAISDSAVSGTWGGEITTQALIALLVFIVLVTLFLALYFERAMALAALVALVHDIVVTAGIYSLIGLEVTPSTVIGLLTILGFSLYDTVVVFDKVRENTRGLLKLTRRTYPEAANLALNQTLMRSLNTSVIAILPVLGLLVIGVGLLGVGTLADLALVQLIGMICGVVSSLFLATPLLVDIKMRDKRFTQQAERVAARRRRAAAVRAGEIDPDDAEPATAELATTGAGRTAAPASAPRPGARPARPTGKAGRSTGGRRRR